MFQNIFCTPEATLPAAYNNVPAQYTRYIRKSSFAIELSNSVVLYTFI